jgi:dipeptidyl aminopeptidase/acylaminoacyl peptidase
METATLEPIHPSDLVRIVVASDPQIARDAGCVIYRSSRFDVAGDRVAGSLWRIRSGGEPERFTSGDNDRMPRIDAAAERLAFVRDVGAEARIHVMPIGGGEARPIGEPLRGLSSLAWSPNGMQIAYTAHAPFDAATAHIYLDEPSGARHIRALPYKTDTDGLLDGRRAQLYVLDVTTGSTRQLTAGDADAGNAVWSPDGTTIAYSLNASAESSMIGMVASIEVADGTTRRVSDGHGPVGPLAFSPSGTQIAWLGHRHGDDTRYHSELLVANVDGSGCRSLSAALDRPAADTIGGDLRSGGSAPPCWHDASRIFALVTDGGATSVRAFDLETGNVTIVAGGEREIYGFAIANDAIAIVYATPLVPSAIALVTKSGERLIADCNSWLSEKALVAPQRLPVTAADGTAIDAWLISPRAPSGSAPLVLEIHGGPHATYGDVLSRISNFSEPGLRCGVRQPARRRGLRTSVCERDHRRLGRRRRLRRALDSRRGARSRNVRPGAGCGGRRIVRRLHDDVAARPLRSIRNRHLDARVQRVRELHGHDRHRIFPRSRARLRPKRCRDARALRAFGDSRCGANHGAAPGHA